MNKTVNFVIVSVLFALIFTMGCLGGSTTTTPAAGNGYTLSVEPKSVVPGGVVTADLRLTNPFENSMKNLAVSVLSTGIPSDYTIEGQVNKSDAFELAKGQEFPVIITLGVPEDALSGTVQPTSQVCFDYTTNFFFDSAIVPRAYAAEPVTLNKNTESGPIGVAVSGLDKVFYENGAATGMLAISNSWGTGSIKEIKSISITPTTKIPKIALSYSGCSSSTGSASVGGTVMASSSAAGNKCNVLTNELAIKNGVSPRITYTYDAQQKLSKESISIERIKGSVDFTYCYDVSLGAISVNAVK